METMLAAVAERPGELRVREVPWPTIDETECLVEILACAICNSTDRKLLEGHFRYKGPEAYPGILGHESVGRVVQCGSLVSSFREGDLVLRPMACYAAGEGPTCMYGGLAQYGKVKDPLHGGSVMQQVIPGDLEPVPATMLITLKETLSWLQRWGVRPGESVVVLGSGPAGVAFGYFAKLLGAKPVLMLGRREERLQRGLALGLDGVINVLRDEPSEVVRRLTGGRGADRVIEAIGAEGMVELGLSLLNPQGRLGVYGIAPTRSAGDMERRAVDIGVARNEWAIEFLNPQEHLAHEQMLWLVRQGLVRLESWYTHVVPLAQTQDGFDLLRRGEAFKVVVDTRQRA